MTLDSLNRPELLRTVSAFCKYEADLEKAKMERSAVDGQLRGLSSEPSLFSDVVAVLIRVGAVGLFLVGIYAGALVFFLHRIDMYNESTLIGGMVFYAAAIILISFLVGKSMYNKSLETFEHESRNVKPNLLNDLAKHNAICSECQEKLTKIYNTYSVPSEYRHKYVWDSVYKKIEFSSTITIGQALRDYENERHRQRVIAENEELRSLQKQAMEEQKKAIEEQTAVIKEASRQIDNRLYDINETNRKIDDYNRYGY